MQNKFNHFTAKLLIMKQFQNHTCEKKKSIRHGKLHFDMLNHVLPSLNQITGDHSLRHEHERTISSSKITNLP